MTAVGGTFAVVYFARVREAIGLDGETVSPPPEVVTLGDLVGWLAGRSARHEAAFADRARLRGAIDDRFAGMADGIAGAREIALFPPVTGG